MNAGSKKIIFLGTYPPRKCGIATFTRDIIRAIGKKVDGSTVLKVMAMDKRGIGTGTYPEEVIFRIRDDSLEDYCKASEMINRDDSVCIVNIQHEFGIFGGVESPLLAEFLGMVRKPKVITFHTVLPNPDHELRERVRTISESCDSVVVMNNFALNILKDDYGVSKSVYLIPHGVPSVPFSSGREEKEKEGLCDRIILSSFGMISRGKGYEYVIESLPEIIARHPNVLYMIIGDTHPVVKEREGDSYVDFLRERVMELGLEDHVMFVKRYLSISDLMRYLKMSDIYISSSLDPNQITSGTLSYALGCGKPVVSTPFLDAVNASRWNTCLLAEFRNPKSFSDSIIRLIENPELRKEIASNAYHFTRKMTWENVALSYIHSLEANSGLPFYHEHGLPEVRLDHLLRITDEHGVIQFSRNVKPHKKSGYTLDDNSRALIAVAMHYKNMGGRDDLGLIRKYLSFIRKVQREDGRFYNYVDQDRNPVENEENMGEESAGNAIWALGYLCSLDPVPEGLKKMASEMIFGAYPYLEDFKSPRGAALVIKGLCFFEKFRPSEGNRDIIRTLSDHLVSIYNDNSDREWKWFEDYLTYSNGRLPESLFRAYDVLGDRRYLDVARSTTDFLLKTTFDRGLFVPVGNRNWHMKNGKKSEYDQQPVDVTSVIQLLLYARRVTGEKKYERKALKAFNWFMGKNSLNQMIYDEHTGGCYDGIGEHSININQGAESTISYLMARLSMPRRLIVVG